MSTKITVTEGRAADEVRAMLLAAGYTFDPDEQDYQYARGVERNEAVDVNDNFVTFGVYTPPKNNTYIHSNTVDIPKIRAIINANLEVLVGQMVETAIEWVGQPVKLMVVVYKPDQWLCEIWDPTLTTRLEKCVTFAPNVSDWRRQLVRSGLGLEEPDEH